MADGKKRLELVTELFQEYGIHANADTFQHFSEMMDALKLYNDRSASYGQAWRQYGALSNLLSAARKVDRLMAVWWTDEEEYADGNKVPLLHKDNLDDAVDLVNYTIFFMRNARSANIFGSTPRRPE